MPEVVPSTGIMALIAILVSLLLLQTDLVKSAPVPALNTSLVELENVADNLNTSSRVFIPLMLKRKTLYRGSTAEPGIQCQSYNIIHENIMPVKSRPDVFWIPHSLIIQDGIRCGTGRKNEYLLVVSGRDIARKSTAEARGLAKVFWELVSNERAFNAFGALHAIDPLHVGFEMTAHRTCGGKIVYSKGTVFLFVSSSLSKLNLGFASFRTRQIGMISVLNNQNLCAYQDDFVESNFIPSSPSPTPKIRVSPAPRKPFDLNDPPVSDRNAKATSKPKPTPKQKTAPKTPTNRASPTPAKANPTAQSSPNKKPSKKPIRPSASPSPRPSEKPGTCFPSDANVELASGAVIPIRSLKIGDNVRTGPASFSKVFMFTHKDENTLNYFVRIQGRSGHFIELSDGHYIPANGEMRAARKVKVGDLIMLADGTETNVASVSTVRKRGLHNPQTVDGSILVNGIVSSTYTEAIRPQAAAALLLPVRAAFVSGIWHAPFQDFFDKSDRGLLSFWLPNSSGH